MQSFFYLSEPAKKLFKRLDNSLLLQMISDLAIASCKHEQFVFLSSKLKAPWLEQELEMLDEAYKLQLIKDLSDQCLVNLEPKQ